MAQYPQLPRLVREVDPRVPSQWQTRGVIPYLVDTWLDDYAMTGGRSEIVETTAAGFSYLFDIAAQRLIAAWGISGGRYGGERDKARMAGSPHSTGPLYHRGHAIPHRLGGTTDINLVPQLGRINIGKFRPLENQAVATPGSFYFTYWIYTGAVPARGGAPGQTPTGVDQGLLTAGSPPTVKVDHFGN